METVQLIPHQENFMSTTFTGPIRVFKRNNPTNDGTLAPGNTGAVQVSQQQFIAPITTTISAGALPTFDIGTTTAAPFVIPAGAILQRITFYETSAPSVLTGGVITINVGGTDVGSITPTTTGGPITMIPTATAAVASVLANVGTSDVTVTFTATAISAITGTLAGTFNIEYTARNVDGSIIQTGNGYTNN
jgi:hypothetical protein